MNDAYSIKSVFVRMCVCAFSSHSGKQLHPLNTYQIIPDQMRLVSVCDV